MKLLILIICLTYPVAGVLGEGCVSLGGKCLGKKCCTGLGCRIEEGKEQKTGRCVKSGSPLAKCKSDADCNGVKGSCPRGFCLNICHSDADCGGGTCDGGNTNTEGSCLFPGGCVALGGKCFKRLCCQKLECRAEEGQTKLSARCMKPKPKQGKCESDEDCNGVKGSCFRGFCLSICRSNEDCDGGRICIEGNTTNGGVCGFDKQLGEITQLCCNGNSCTTKFVNGTDKCVICGVQHQPCKTDKQCCSGLTCDKEKEICDVPRRNDATSPFDKLGPPLFFSGSK